MNSLRARTGHVLDTRAESARRDRQIGKTCLVAEARRMAGDKGLRVLSAQGGELEREFPFGVVRQLFEPEVSGTKRALAGAAGPARPVFEAAGGGEAGAPVADPSFASLHGSVLGDPEPERARTAAARGRRARRARLKSR